MLVPTSNGLKPIGEVWVELMSPIISTLSVTLLLDV